MNLLRWTARVGTGSTCFKCGATRLEAVATYTHMGKDLELCPECHEEWEACVEATLTIAAETWLEAPAPSREPARPTTPPELEAPRELPLASQGGRDGEPPPKELA